MRALPFALLALGTACSSGTDENSDRAGLFTDIAESANFSAPSDLAGLQGSATYKGVAVADFGGFGGTADATINADFSSQTLSGEMTGWEDRDARNFELDGRVSLTNGSIASDGTLNAQVAGNIERTRRGPEVSEEAPSLVVFTGEASGAFYDNNSGQAARVVQGDFVGTTVDGGGVSGSFIADR
jgi:hypothetical protein